MNIYKILEIGMIFLILFLILSFFALTLLVFLLWNWIMPTFDIAKLTFWKAGGLIILVQIFAQIIHFNFFELIKKILDEQKSA